MLRESKTKFLIISCLFTLLQCRSENPPSLPSQKPSPSAKEIARHPATSSKETKLVLLGTGTPVPEPTRSGPSSAVIVGDRAYLVDFGAGVVRRAAEAFNNGIKALDPSFLNLAFATHLHSDHTSGFSDLILTPQAVGRRAPLRVYGPPGIQSMTDHLLAAYEVDRAIRIRGRNPAALPGYQVEAIEIKEGVIHRDDAVTVTAFPVKHGVFEHAFGFRFDTPNRTIVISGDTAPTDAVIEACNGCDILLHEVYCLRGFHAIHPNIQPYHATSHTSTKELATLAAKAKPKHLVLYHQLFFGCSEDQIMTEIKSAYSGQVSFGNDLDVY